MSKILVPFKYTVFENLEKKEKVAYYEDEFSHVYRICKGCLTVYDSRESHKSRCPECMANLSDVPGVAKRLQANIDKLNRHIDKDLAQQEAIWKSIGEEAIASMPWFYRKPPKRISIEELTNRQKVSILLAKESLESKKDGTKRKSAGKVRKESKDVVSNDVQADTVKRKSAKGRAKAGVV